MLLQSQWTEPAKGAKDDSSTRILELLPALPKEWPNGSVTGLCARDGFEVDLTWSNGALTRAVVRSKLGKPCDVRYAGRDVELVTKSGGEYLFDGRLREVEKN